MQIEVMSRSRAKKESFRTDIPSTIIVSITDIEKDSVKFNNNRSIKAICRVKFDDVDSGNNAITEQQAKQITEFIKKNQHKAERIIVHCEAGICRSSGVAAAIMKWIDGDDMPIFKDGRFTPNMKCYRMVLNAFFIEENEEEIQNKEQTNITAWKAVNDI
jgi:predicted protein tyrosine phosphatase